MSIIGSILQQLIAPTNVALPSVPLESARIGSDISIISSQYNHINVVINALDEYSDQFSLLKALRSWQQTIIALIPSISLHIMITGRTSVDADVVKFLKPDLQLNILSKDQDVQAFVYQSLSDHDRISQWIEGTPEFELFMINAIIARLAGMYVYLLPSLAPISAIDCLSRPIFCSAASILSHRHCRSRDSGVGTSPNVFHISNHERILLIGHQVSSRTTLCRSYSPDSDQERSTHSPGYSTRWYRRHLRGGLGSNLRSKTSTSDTW